MEEEKRDRAYSVEQYEALHDFILARSYDYGIERQSNDVATINAFYEANCLV